METLLEKPLSKTDEITETGIITICAYKPKTQLPVVCRPMMDKSGKLFTGQGQFGYYELLTEEEKRKLPFIFDYETSIVLEDGKTFNMNDPYDRGVWKWLRKHPYLALDRAAGEGNRDAVFYMANAVKEAKERVDKTARIDEARPAVRKLSHNDQIRVAKALGLDGALGFTPDQILDWLLNKASSDPETVLATIDPGNKVRVNAKVALKDFIKYGVIARMKDGAFYFGGEEGVNLGHTEEMVVDYMIDPANSERVKGMKTMFVERSKQASE
jgi:hypothetical protein